MDYSNNLKHLLFSLIITAPSIASINAQRIIFEVPCTRNARNYFLSNCFGMPFSVGSYSKTDKTFNLIFKDKILLFSNSIHGFKLEDIRSLPQPPENLNACGISIFRENMGYITTKNNTLYFKGLKTFYKFTGKTWCSYWNFNQLQPNQFENNITTTAITISEEDKGIIIGGCSNLFEIFTLNHGIAKLKNSISYNEINSSYRNFHIWNNLGPAKTSIINGVIYAYFPSNGRLFSFSLTNTDFHEYSVPWHAWIGSNHPNEGGTWVNNSGNTPVEPHFPCTVAFIPHPNISKIIMIGMHYNFSDGLYFQGELYMAGNKFSPAFAPENPYDDQIKFLNSVGELSALTEIIEKFQNNPKTNP